MKSNSRADPQVRAGPPGPAEADRGVGRGPGGPPYSPPYRWIATWFGCGYSPVAPGTAGSLAAVAIGVFFQPWQLAVVAAVMTPAGIWAAAREEKASGKTDPGRVVVDEVVGQWIALAGAAQLNWKSVLAGFLLFRLFDIWKPFPIRRMEALPGGWGIMADDVLAGLYAALVLYAAGCFNLY